MVIDCHGWLCGNEMCKSCHPTVPKEKFENADGLLRLAYSRLTTIYHAIKNHMEHKLWMIEADIDLDRMIKRLDDYFNE